MRSIRASFARAEHEKNEIVPMFSNDHVGTHCDVKEFGGCKKMAPSEHRNGLLLVESHP